MNRLEEWTAENIEGIKTWRAIQVHLSYVRHGTEHTTDVVCMI